jgi:tetratricopeptide (TPR) repeat protein
VIREGVTGVAGHVSDPFVDGAIRPDVLFPAYVSGLNLVESFYLAMPFLSWQTVVFGDPLCAPFRTGNLGVEDTAPPVDKQSRLPQYFHRRRLAALVATGVTEAAAALMLEGEALRKLGDEAGLRRVLEEATSVDPAANAAHLLLATAYEKEGAYDLAIERYRLVLFTTPHDPVAANNLAYALAVYKNAPAEALPIAEKAHATSRGDARIIDTLGWIHHLLGNHAEAGTLIAQAAAAAPAIAEIQLHLAFAQSALGRIELARMALDKSIELDTTFANREDVKKLRSALTTR